MITATELDQKYRDFFVRNGHAALPSASLVPANDATVLFTTAGMHPLVPNLLGEPHPAGPRLTSCQKCIRTGDIDAVGDPTHLTFFEMLGNWSLGDYFRRDAIRYSFEFLTGPEWLGLPLERLGVTCFAGDAEVSRDQESAEAWLDLGLPSERIQFLGRDDNWWGPAGATGPCGPDTEIFYWMDHEPAPRVLDVADRRWFELYNNVFMAYARTSDGTFERLSEPCVDTGMGVERTLAALNGATSVYGVDTMHPILTALARGRSAPGVEGDRRLRIVTDHLRAACFIIADGVEPSNRDRGYVVRRLIRRAALYARELELGADWFNVGKDAISATLGARYPELVSGSERIDSVLADEIERFQQSLNRGLREIGKRRHLDGAAAFDLYQTYGFPWELTCEIAAAHGQELDRALFRAEFERHQKLSRSASAGSFVGGLADHSSEIVADHTLTHLLNAALRRVLGGHVVQKGSNITRERLRFDFAHSRKLSDQERQRVEQLVNDWIAMDLEVRRDEMAQADARALGAIGAFGEKYGERVSVYSIVDRASGAVVSREFCGGPHVEHTGGIVGRFSIVREEALGASVRRIKAVLTPGIPSTCPGMHRAVVGRVRHDYPARMPELAVEDLKLVVENRPMGGDGGPTLRVLAAPSERELLRFDCFTRGAHWHIDPDGRDERADMPDGSGGVDFTLHELSERIDTLLASAGHLRSEALAHSTTWKETVERVGQWLRESID